MTTPETPETATADSAPVSAPVVIECNGCGYRLPLPDGFPEGDAFRCAQCGLVMRNVEAARAFRWASFDSFTQKWGASRVNLIGGTLGSIIWLPILAAVTIVSGHFDALEFVLIAVPYLVLIGTLMLRRGRRPVATWLGAMWVGLGLYLIYLTMLPMVVSGGMLQSTASSGPSLASLLPLGVIATVVGIISIVSYRLRAARTPAISGEPPPTE